MRQGFDTWFGLPYSHDMQMTAPRDRGLDSAAYYEPKPEYWNVALMRDDAEIERPVDHRTLTRRYTDEAVRFIESHQRGPFFLYLAHNLPHIPLARSPEFVGHSEAGIYGDVIEELDWSTGRILDTLQGARPRSPDAGRLHQRQRAVAALQDARRLGRSAARGQGHDLGRRRPHPGDLLVARHHRTRDHHGDRLGAGPAADGGGARRRAPPRRSRARRGQPGAGAHDRPGSASSDPVLLLGQRAARRPQGPLQGPLHHQRRLRAGVSPGPSTHRRCSSICRRTPANASTWPRSTRTSSPTWCGRPRPIAAPSCRASRSSMPGTCHRPTRRRSA